VNNCELYIMIALTALVAPPREVEADEEAACSGFPLARLRMSRVRRMYSLLHVASAVSLQKARLSERNVSARASVSVVDELLREFGPGKKRAKAARQACGVVTREWNWWETRETEERSVGVRWEMA
jgi:hypothetical protein